jgi:predicted transcriptional regulator YheO
MEKKVSSISYFLKDSNGNYVSNLWIKIDSWEHKLIVRVINFILFIEELIGT